VGDGRRGLVFGITAYLLWGAFPLYFPLLEPASALEILANRVAWSAVVVLLVLLGQRRLRAVRRLTPAAWRQLAVAGAVIAVNWGCYIWGVNHHHVVETSLGYFINPLVTVGLAVVVLRERLRSVQWLALALGAAAVLVLTVDYGRPPWLALVLACSFGTYGLVKKQVAVAAPVGLLVESGVLLLPALATMAVLAAQSHLTFASRTPGHAALLASAGVVTAVPLLFFAGAATRLPLATLGMLQYLAPVLQLLVGVLVRHEPMPASRLAGFAMVWVALAVLSVDGWRHRGRADPVTEPEIVPLEQALGTLHA
jgi:chloramphenicol-sensitive protein RarD